jgi:hypothetical protein
MTPAYGVTASTAVLVPPFNVAEIFTFAAAAPLLLVIVNPTEVAPAATVTLAGTVAADVLLEDSVIFRCVVVPDAGALKVI